MVLVLVLCAGVPVVQAGYAARASVHLVVSACLLVAKAHDVCGGTHPVLSYSMSPESCLGALPHVYHLLMLPVVLHL